MKTVIHDAEVIENCLHPFNVGEVLGGESLFGLAADVARESNNTFADAANDGGTFERMFALELLLDLRLDLPVGRRRGFVSLRPQVASEQGYKGDGCDVGAMGHRSAAFWLFEPGCGAKDQFRSPLAQLRDLTAPVRC